MLSQGEVIAVEVGQSDAFNSQLTFLRLTYSADASPVLPPCYAAEYDEGSGSSYLLLADLSESHAPPEIREQEINIEDDVLAPENMVRVINTLAQFHAYWWQHPLLDSGQFPVGYWSRNAERFALYQERRQQSWASLVAAFRDWACEALLASTKA